MARPPSIRTARLRRASAPRPPLGLPLPSRILPALALGLGLSGCGGSDGGPTEPPATDQPAALAPQGLASVGGTVGTALSAPVRVRVSAADGSPVAGVTVQWEAGAGSGSVAPEGSGITDAAGVAGATWTLGTAAGAQELRARVGTLPPLVFTADARADLPALLTLESPGEGASGGGGSPGQAGTAWVGGPFPDQVRVRAQDRFGNPVLNRQLGVEAETGVGWFPEASPRTDAEGRISFPWYASPDPAGGVQRLRVTGGPGSDAPPVVVEGEALPIAPGERVTGHRDFVEYTPGTLPLVLTAAHGGTLLPDDLADRSWGTLRRDLETDTLALLVADSLEALTGARPHLVRLHLHRTKLDANRALDEAAQGDPGAIRAWHEFHLWTETAMEAVRRAHPRGVYLDLHGHGHDIQRLELGYLLTGTHLASPDEALNEDPLASRSSLGALAAWLGATPAQAVRGPSSLGARFHAEGYPAVPSPQDPHPAGAPFFSGGYNTRRYGCSEEGSGNPLSPEVGTICGFQLEANRIGVRDSPQALARFAGASARVIASLLEDIGAISPPAAAVPAGAAGAAGESPGD